MAFQSVPETFELIVQYVCNNVQMVNTFYASKSGGYNSSDLSDACEVMFDLWEGEMLPQFPVAYILTSVAARGLEDENDIEALYNPTDVGGSVGSNPTPNNVAFVVSRRSGLTGRSARGRVYLGPLPQANLQTDENFYSATQAALMVDGLNTIKVNLAVIGLTEVIVSRYSDGVKRATGVTFAVSEYAFTDLRVDSRRDRLP